MRVAAGPDPARRPDQQPPRAPPTRCSSATAPRRRRRTTTPPTRAAWRPTSRRSSRRRSRGSTTSWSAATPSRPTTRPSRSWPSWCRWRSPTSTPTPAATAGTSPRRSAARSSTPTPIVKLVRPGIAEYEPVVYRVVDATRIIATFDLTGAPHGLYDLKVINPDGEQAIVPYRFLVEQAIEPDVTIGVGGPRVILAGDTGTYSVALRTWATSTRPTSTSRSASPRWGSTRSSTTCPSSTSAPTSRRRPDGSTTSPGRPSTRRSTRRGTVLAPGYLFDEAAGGFTGFTFNVTTYPGLRELHDRNFEALKAQLYAAFPELPRPACSTRPRRARPDLPRPVRALQRVRRRPGRLHDPVHPVPVPHRRGGHGDDARRVRRPRDRRGGEAAARRSSPTTRRHPGAPDAGRRPATLGATCTWPRSSRRAAPPRGRASRRSARTR